MTPRTINHIRRPQRDQEATGVGTAVIDMLINLKLCAQSSFVVTVTFEPQAPTLSDPSSHAYRCLILSLVQELYPLM